MAHNLSMSGWSFASDRDAGILLTLGESGFHKSSIRDSV